MSDEREQLRITLPPHQIGDTVFFHLKGKPVDMLLRVATRDGTVITAQLANYGQVEIFCGADRKDLDVELLVPDSELLTVGLDRVPAPTRSKKK
jgi:hypothetical protein